MTRRRDALCLVADDVACQVASFSSLDTCALLRETERAVDRDGVNLLDMHQQLIKLRVDEKRAQLAASAERTKLAELEATNRQLEVIWRARDLCVCLFVLVG